MREIRLHGSEGGGADINRSFLPLSCWRRETWFARNVPLAPVFPPHAPRPTPFAVGRKLKL